MSLSNKEKENVKKFKIIFIGDYNVGKTSLIQKQCFGQFSEKLQNTIICDFLFKNYKIQNFAIRGIFWDTAGQQKYCSLSSCFYRDSDAVVVCFDLNNKKSFQNVLVWIKQAKEKVSHLENFQIFLVGCKADLQHLVSKQQILQLCNKMQLTYFQTQVRKEREINQFFKKMIHQLISNKPFLNQRQQYAQIQQKIQKKNCYF